MAWTTIDQVQALTGQIVSDAALALASGMIDTRAGTSPDMPADSISARDRAVLSKATAWQAVWLEPRMAEILTGREAVRSTSGAGVTVNRDAISTVMYAPLALLELKNLSWFGTRREPTGPTLPPRLSFLNEQSDAYGEWRAL